jgi:hypothetical protein
MRAALALACLLSLISPAAARAQQEDGSPSPETLPAETLRLRIVNAPLGPVEASADRGKSWFLVARVLRPASQSAPGAALNLPSVERASPQGIAFGIGGKRLLRLVPDTPAARRDLAAIVVNVKSGDPLFTNLLPPVGAAVQQEVNRRPLPLISGYAPRENDVLQILAARSDTPTDRLPSLLREAAESYRQAALARLRAQGKSPTTGTLTVVARLHPTEKPAMVTFHLDGNMIAMLNRSPFTLRWNTRDWPNGEHLLEVRALDANGAVLTSTRTLVVVDN